MLVDPSDANTDEFSDGGPLDDESTEAVLVDCPYPYPNQVVVLRRRKSLSPQAVQAIAVAFLIFVFVVASYFA